MEHTIDIIIIIMVSIIIATTTVTVLFTVDSVQRNGTRDETVMSDTAAVVLVLVASSAGIAVIIVVAVYVNVDTRAVYNIPLVIQRYQVCSKVQFTRNKNIIIILIIIIIITIIIMIISICIPTLKFNPMTDIFIIIGSYGDIRHYNRRSVCMCKRAAVGFGCFGC